MIPYGRQHINEEDIAAVVDVLRSDFITQGPVVPRFERAVAEYCDVRHAVAVSSGTSALHLACLVLDVGPGDVVWTSPITFVASANCARYCGARVDFVDINPVTFNMDADKLAAKLKMARNGGDPLPKAVIPVHFAGQSCDMAAIQSLAKEYGFQIIEDAAHAIGGRYHGEPVGSCRYSSMTVFSFHPVKTITTGEGGMVLTNDPALAERLSRLRSHGITRDPTRMMRAPDGPWYYEQVELGYNYRITDIQAALGLSQLLRLDEFVATRRDVAKRYDEAFSGTAIHPQAQQEDIRSAYHLYVVRVPAAYHATAFATLHKQEIAVNLHYIPLHLQPDFQRLGFTEGYCPDSEAYYRTAISLPVYHDLSAEQQDRVVSVLKSDETVFSEGG